MGSRADAARRLIVCLVPAGIGAGLLYPLLVGVGAGRRAAACIAIATVPAAAWALWKKLPPVLEGVPRRASLIVLWTALGLGAVGATARLATYMADETRVGNSIYAFDEFLVHHSCLSAHYQSASLQRAGVANIYERTNYEGPEGEPKFLNSFVIDVYLYPPPFLLLSRLALAISDDFLAWRGVWFGLEGGLVAAAFLIVAAWIGGALGQRAALLSVVAWLSFPTLMSLQHGNVHLATIAGSVLAMLALERGRLALGGGILAALTLSKVFPGLFVLILIFQRRWRALAWIAGFGVLFLAASFLFLGTAPWQALLTYHLPRMSSGAALETQFAHPDTMAANLAFFGLVQKLMLLGVPAPANAPVIASWIYTLLLAGIAFLAARATAGAAPSSEARLERVLVWLAVVELASLRAPFTPDVYGLFAILWILALMLAAIEPRGLRPAVLVILVIVANFITPTVPLMPLGALLGITLVIQIVFLALLVRTVVVPARARAPR